MKRRIANLLAAVSLVLCLATLGVWVRSQFAYDVVSRQAWDASADKNRVLKFVFSAGRAELVSSVAYYPNARYSSSLSYVTWGHSTNGSSIDHGHHWLWFVHPARSTFTYSPPLKGWVDKRAVGCGLLPTAGLFGLLPLSRLFVRRMVLPGRCARCGYDLRATPDRCPECGTAATRNGAAAAAAAARR